MLSVIQGFSELALDNLQSPDDIEADLAEIGNACERASQITRQLLSFAKQSSREPQVLDLNATLEGMLKMLRRLIGEDIKLEWRPSPDLWPVLIDPSHVDQLLANLCVNARDAIHDVGVIEILTRNVTYDDGWVMQNPHYRAGEYVSIAVRDSGHGMDTETLEHLFEPFYTTKGGGGTGLGLATVYGIVEQNQGFIVVESTLNAGSVFTIHLPRHMEAVLTEAKSQVSRSATGQGEVVLLVEDEPSILNLVAQQLQSLGYRVLPCDSPERALETVRTCAFPIHLVLTDVIMPGMNGRMLCDRIRALAPGIRCLYMSGYTADVLHTRGINDVTHDLLHKPFSVSELATRVRAVWDR